MEMAGVDAGGLQSGFVLAVIIIAVLFAERLGGTAELAKRAFQVALGVALALLAMSATAALVRPPEAPEELLESGGIFGDSFDSLQADEQAAEARGLLREAAQNASEVRTIHLGLGVAFFVGGLAALARLSVLPVGAMLGGILLLLFGSPAAAPSPTLGDFFGAILGAFLPTVAGIEAGQAHDIAQFAVLLAGVCVLAAVGYRRWERPPAVRAEPEGTPV